MTSRSCCITSLLLVIVCSPAIVHADRRPSVAEQPGLRRGAAPVSLVDRATQYWERRKAKDLAAAYVFYCDAYKSRVSRDQYLQLTRLTRFGLTEVKVTADPAAHGRAQVTVAYKYLMPVLDTRPLEGKTTEMWAQDKNGEWCKEDEPLVLPFPSGGRGTGSDPQQKPVTERHRELLHP
jgi:hypothetical protein